MRWNKFGLHMLLASLVGAVARAFSLRENLNFPHGDVLLDALTARSLTRGQGFWTPWEEGTTLIADPIGSSIETFGHPADQHGPLWPLLGAPIVKLIDDPVLSLQIVSWIVGLLAIPVAGLLLRRFQEQAALLGMWAVALCLPLCDYSGNGSLYSAQVLGVLALPLVAGDLQSKKRAFAAGAVLGLLFLLNYQCVVLLPAFAAVVFLTKGIAGGIKPLLAAAAGCLLVTLPWFVRNALVFGNPVFTTNLDYVKYFLNLHRVDEQGDRPVILNDSTPGELIVGFLSWLPKNTSWFIVTIHLAIAAFPFFAFGGFQRMCARDESGRRRFDGLLVTAFFIALLLAAGLWPQPKSRYVVPLVALVIIAGSVELCRGARALPAIGTAVVTLLLGFFLDAPTSAGFPWKEMRFLIPTAALGFIAFSGIGRKILPALCILVMTAHGAFRVYISLDKVFGARHVFDLEVYTATVFGPPIATFYDIMSAPAREGFERLRVGEMKLIVRAMKDADVKRVLGPVDLAYTWKGALVSTPWYFNQFPYKLLAKCREVFQLDGAVMGRNMFEREAVLQQFLFETNAEIVYPPPERIDRTDLVVVRWK